MGWRYYTAKEFARLRRADEARRKQMERAWPKFFYKVQEELAEVLPWVAADRQDFAKVLLRLKRLSPKQEAAAQRFVDRAVVARNAAKCASTPYQNALL